MRRCLLAALALPLLAAPSPAADKKPNVLFLLADDMRADSIAALGNPVAKTPTLDALVGRGFAMTNAYCLGGNSAAVCTPSRNMLLSGNAYFRWKDFAPPDMSKAPKGLYAPGDGPNFPLAMRDAGYLTYHHGKRGNTAPLIQAKFEVNKYLKNDEEERRGGEPGREIVDEAIAFLKANRDPRPVFLYLAFGNPHDPRVAARKYLDQYDPAKIPLPKNFLAVHPFDNGELVVRDEQLLPGPGPRPTSAAPCTSITPRSPHSTTTSAGSYGRSRTRGNWTTRSSSSRPTRASRSAATGCSASRACTTTA